MSKKYFFIFILFFLFLNFFGCKSEIINETFIVSFDSNGGNFIEPTKNIRKDSTISLPTPIKEGFVFVGWFYGMSDTDQQFTENSKVSNDLTLHARWESNLCIIDFVDYDGTLLKSDTIEKGESVTAPTNPEREGYTFIGWDKQLTNITQDLTIKALYSINTYDVKFESNGGNIIETVEDVEYKSSIDLPTPVKDGYTFNGWYYGESVNDDQFTSNSIVISNLTLYARWVNDLVDVKFVDYDGSLIKSETIKKGGSVIAPRNPIREGYTFLGWDKQLTNITQDLTIKALYSINYYTVNFDSNGGNIIEPVDDVEYKSSIVLPTPVKDGYTFKGWYYGQSVNDDQFTSISVVDSDLTIYARWESSLYTVQYVDYDYTVLKLQEVEIGNSATPPTNPEREGYTFIGWSRSNENILEDTIIKAEYNINTYNISYKIVDDTITKVIAEEQHSFALTSSGDLFAWGYNNYGQLGDGTTTNKIVPTNITAQFNLNNEFIIDVFSGDYHTFALTNLGRIFAWGYNVCGQLGDNTTINRLTPVDITSQFGLNEDESIIKIEGGSKFNIALSSNGRVFSWGYNSYGQLGDGTNTEKLIPFDITPRFTLTGDEKIINISSGWGHSIAYSSKNRIFAWGYNSLGQLGDGTTNNKVSPYVITFNFKLFNGEFIESIKSGNTSNIAISSLGRVFTWGQNNTGQLGDGSNISSFLPLDITSRFILHDNEKVTDIYTSSSSYHLFALTSHNRIFAWGNNYYGQLGDGTQINKMNPTDITSEFVLINEERIISFSLGVYHTLALSSSGHLYAFGYNNKGQLGDGSTTSTIYPWLITHINESELIFSDSYVYGEMINLYQPIFFGQSFDGWYSDLQMTKSVDLSTMPASNITLYGKTYNLLIIPIP